jgi:LmbE family N-acetylglucosaminyl deacetylase
MLITPEERVLVVAPHCDDAELGVGGYLWRLSYAQAVVGVVILATGSIEFRHAKRVVSETERRNEAVDGLSRVGVGFGEVLFPFDGRDTKMDAYPLSEYVKVLDELITNFKPTQFLLPLSSTHPDHQVTHRACMAACRPSNGSTIRFVGAYEYTASSWGASPDSGKGGAYIDITGTPLEKKKEALACHKSQMRQDEVHPWSVDSAEALARLRGMEAGVMHAELIHILRMKV